MRDWIRSSKEDDASPARPSSRPGLIHYNNNYNRARGNDVLANDKRSRSRGRMQQRSRAITPITKSLSPDSKMRKKGQDFLRRIEALQKDLEIQGESLAILQQDMQPEGIAPRTMKTKETESQRKAAEDIRRQNEARKRQEEQKQEAYVQQKPVKPVNYNAIRRQEMMM